MQQRQAAASTRIRLVTPIRAAIYARVSSDQQVERHTIGSQVEALLARAAADGHVVAPELRFLDDGHSGASLIRPALERLRDLAAMAAIDVVYVHAPDRLARSYAHRIHPAETAAQVRLGFGDGLRAHFLASLSTAWVRASTSGSVGSKWPPTHSSLSACSSWSGSAIAARNSP
jgi:hypothetical protein